MSAFNDIINGDQPTLVDFSATWCGPCKMMEPILKELSSKMGDKVRILKVDIDRNRPTADHYGIQSVPTLILFRKGEIKWRKSGVVQTNALAGILNRYL